MRRRKKKEEQDDDDDDTSQNNAAGRGSKLFLERIKNKKARWIEKNDRGEQEIKNRQIIAREMDCPIR